jgi:hypothetical protein
LIGSVVRVLEEAAPSIGDSFDEFDRTAALLGSFIRSTQVQL